MKVELDNEEAWELMSRIVARLADGASLPDRDRAAIRRWRSETMKPGGEAIRILARKINDDLADVARRKTRSPIRKPDWR